MEPEEYNYVPSVFDAVAAVHGAPSEATRSQRFLNFLVDGLACVLLFYPVGSILSAVLYRFGADIFAAVRTPLRAWPAALGLFLLIAGAYYFVVETATRGRSLGKWLTGTEAVREDGGLLASRDVFRRSLLRLIPLDPISGLAGRIWHDRFSKTRVVQRRKTFAPVESQLPDASANYDVLR